MKTAEEMIDAPTLQEFRELEAAADAACEAEIAAWSALTSGEPPNAVAVKAKTQAASDAVARVAGSSRRFQAAARLQWLRCYDREPGERIVVSVGLDAVGVIEPVAVGVAYRALWIVDGAHEGEWRLQRRGIVIAHHDPNVGPCWKWRGFTWIEAA